MVKGACGKPQEPHEIYGDIVPVDAAHAIYFYPSGGMQALYCRLNCGQERNQSGDPMCLCTPCARKLGYIW